MRQLLMIAVFLLVGGCQLGLPKGGGGAIDASQANPITGDAISVTSLDGPTGQTPTPVTSDIVPEPVPETPAVAQMDAAPAAEVAVKTPAQLACEKKGGRWSMAGSSNASFCQTATRDAGRLCRKETDCEGYCLARSGTCAPYTPLFGCNEVLTPSGHKITQCID